MCASRNYMKREFVFFFDPRELGCHSVGKQPESRHVSRSGVAGNWHCIKPCLKEASNKEVYIFIKMCCCPCGLPPTRCATHKVEIHWLSGKKNGIGETVWKKLILAVFRDMKGNIIIDLLEKGSVVNCASLCQLLWQEAPYLLNSPSYIYLSIYQSAGALEYAVCIFLDIALNYMMGKVQYWNYGECRVTFYWHYSKFHLDPDW